MNLAPSRSTRPLARCGGLAFWVVSGAACAAGGHFDVDDAAMLDPGRCQVEGWATRRDGSANGGPAATGAHAGAACRVGPFEWGLNLDRSWGAGGGATAIGPQVKWVSGTDDGVLAWGVAASASFDAVHGGRPALTLLVPVRIALGPAWVAHLNLGLDRDAAGLRTRRQGAAAEWVLGPRLTLLAERGRFGGERERQVQCLAGGQGFTAGNTGVAHCTGHHLHRAGRHIGHPESSSSIGCGSQSGGGQHDAGKRHGPLLRVAHSAREGAGLGQQYLWQQ